jgi:hypothetical protein
MKMKMQFLAFRGKCCGFRAMGWMSPAAFNSSDSIPASAMAPIPLQALHRKSLREVNINPSGLFNRYK